MNLNALSGCRVDMGAKAAFGASLGEPAPGGDLIPSQRRPFVLLNVARFDALACSLRHPCYVSSSCVLL